MHALDNLDKKKKESPDAESCKALLDRILTSSHLRRSTRLRDLLAYVGNRALKDGRTLIREQEIGVELFGRPEGYDTSADTIVRVNATELRKRIELYFNTDGLQEPILAEIPRGSYIPVFRYRSAETAKEGEHRADASAFVSSPPEAAPKAPRPPSRDRLKLATISLAVACALLLAICIHLWMQNRAMDRSMYPWQFKPSVAAFWSGFLTANTGTDFVIGDPSLTLFQAIGKKQLSLQDYLNHSYISQLQDQSLSPETRFALGLLANRILVSRGGFTMAQHLLALDPISDKIRVYFARNYSPSLINQDNVILFGSSTSNPWYEVFDSRLNFVSKSDIEVLGNSEVPHATVENRAPAAGEPQTYTPSAGVGYCTIAYLPNPAHTGKVLLLGGTNSEAAQACGDFLLSEDELSTFRKKLQGNDFPYFELVLKTSQVVDTPLTATLVAYRIHPEIH